MLSDWEVGQFHVLGYVILRGCLSAEEVEQVQIAFERVIATAPRYDYFGNGGTRMLAPFVQADETFDALIDHPTLMQAMRAIDGTEFLYVGGSDMWSNLDDTPWHTDHVPGSTLRTVKVAIYLDETTEGGSALNVIPGSQHPEVNRAVFRHLKGYWSEAGGPRLGIDRDSVPGAVTLLTSPGDVLLWDNRIWHSAWKRTDGKARRNLFIGYIRDPLDDQLRIREVRANVEEALGDTQSYIFSAEMLSRGGEGRQKMAMRLEELGTSRVRERSSR